MKDGLYHRELGLPLPESSFRLGTVGLTYSAHAKEAATTDRYGHISLPDTLNTNLAALIEVEVFGGRITKLVYRTAYNREYDLVIVIALGGRVKTVWLNSKRDTHSTLDYSKYNQLLKRVS